jgi:acyl-CoA thioesterase-1
MEKSKIFGALFTALFLPSLSAQTRVAFLGDSITHGFTPAQPSYRTPLWSLLSNSCVDFVGTRIGTNGGSSPTVGALPTGLPRFDQDHEAQSGRSALDMLLQWGVAVPVAADVYVIQAGTNDLAWLQPVMTPGVTLTVLVALANAIHALPGSQTVIVCTLPGAHSSVLGQPGISQSLLSDIATLNLNITASPSPFPADTFVAQIDAGFDPSPNVDTFDGIHPNDAGEAKIAATLFSVLAPKVISTPGFACFKEFGMGCEYPDANGDPALGRMRQIGPRPTLGAAFDLGFFEIPPGTVPFAFMSLTDFAPVLIGPAAPGCSLLVNPAVLTGATLVGGQWVLSLPIPNIPTLVGTEFFVQGGTVGGSFNSLDALNTNAGIVRIGN